MSRSSLRLMRGFTLVELMLTIALLGFVLLTARMLFSQVVVTKAVMTRDAARVDSARNGEQLARLLLQGAEAEPDSADRFVGNPSNAEFDTWCRVGSGWLERCRVLLSLDYREDTTVLVAVLPGGRRIDLLRQLGTGVLRYVDHTTSDTTWLPNWGVNMLIPNAIALVNISDTIVMTTGRPDD